MKRGCLSFLLAMLAIVFFTATPVLADSFPDKTEISISGGLSKPSEGETVWNLDGAFLFPVGPFVAGPDFGFLDMGQTDGWRAGVAGELNFGKKAGLFGGVALHRFGGDFGDIADYDGQLRFGGKFGDGNAALKVYAQRTWTKDAAGDVSAPNSTDVILGIIWKK